MNARVKFLTRHQSALDDFGRVANDAQATSTVQDLRAAAQWKFKSESLKAATPSLAKRIQIARWRCEEKEAEVRAIADGADAILAIALSATDATIAIDNAVVHDGRIACGAFQLVTPGHSVWAIITKPADLVRLVIPRLIFENSTSNNPSAGTHNERVVGPTYDRVVHQLAQGIVGASNGGHPIDQRFADPIGAAILARVIEALAIKRRERAGGNGLIAWRLKRVIGFIEANLEGPMSLADMAGAAGLSRMHFAAQFRVATGLRPHTYLTQRRIERGQDLLRRTTMPLVEIALSVGFQTQAHFTTIFGQVCGEPPGRWRHAGAALDARVRADVTRVPDPQPVLA